MGKEKHSLKYVKTQDDDDLEILLVLKISCWILFRSSWVEPGRVSANDLSHDDDGALSSGKDDQKCDDDDDDDYGALAQVMAKCS